MPILFSDIEVPLPPDFRKWLSQLEKKSTSTLNDCLFVSVLYNALESGFLLDSCQKMDNFSTYDFNANVLKIAGGLQLDELYSIENNQYCTVLRLGPKDNKKRNFLLTARGSTTKKDEYLLCNLRETGSCLVSSLCLSTKDSVRAVKDWNPSDRFKLSIEIKDELFWPIKSIWMQRELKGCFPHYAGLPYPAMRLIRNIKPMRSHKRAKQTNEILYPSCT